MINSVTEFTLTNISWIGVDFIDPASKFETSAAPPRQVRVLDYACGPGTMTAALQGHATEFIGIDLSENMVKAYNARFPSAEEDGTDSIHAHAVVGDLLDSTDPTPSAFADDKFFNFDLVVVGLGFHHFQNLEEATKRFAARLKSGGVFMIVDFLPHGNDPLHPDAKHPAAHTVAHHGFSEERLKELFGGAGLVDVDMVVMPGEVLMRGLSPRKVFLGRGKKP